jgi:guanine deaminase
VQLLLFGRLITPLKDGDTLDVAPGWLAVDRSGLILGTGGGAPPRALEGLEVVDLRGFLAVPGFVDVHLHFPQIDARGRGAGELLVWLNRTIFPAEEACVDPRVARDRAARTFRALARNGVTTAAVFGSPHAEATDVAFTEARRSGLRIFLGKTMMDRNGPDGLVQSREQNLEASRRLCRRWDHDSRGRLRYAFSPRFAPACSFELLRDTARTARELGARVQTHLAESPREVEWVRELFPGSESYTDVYRAAGLLSAATVLAHAVHLSDAEWALLAVHGASVAHCPTANFYLRSGTFDLARALRENLCFGLGSDVGAGPSFSPFDVMRHALYLAPIPPSDALYRATLGGAQALGVADRVGSLEVEKDADVVVLDPQVAEVTLDAPLETLLGAVIHRGGSAAVAGVTARGDWVHATPALER